jgi:hypothetical protein
VPARNSATTPATLGHGFDCPMGDGGHCALPSPPILVQGGEMRQAPDAAAQLSDRPIASLRLAMMKSTGVDGMREVIELSTQEKPGEAGAIVLPASCGHVFTARVNG